MSRTLCTLLWVTTVLLIYATNGMQADPLLSLRNDIPAVRRVGVDIPMLPTLKKLFREISGGVEEKKYTYKGCVIDMSGEANVYKLDLSDQECQDIMSIPNLLKKLTGGGDDKRKSKFMCLMKKFNVDEIEVNTDSKDVSFTASAKEPFYMFRRTLQVKEGKITLDFNYKAGFSYENVGIDLSGEVNVGKTTSVTFSLNKESKSKIASFGLEANKVRIKDLFNIFKKGRNSNGDDDDDDEDEDQAGTSFFKKIVIENPKFTGLHDLEGDSEFMVQGAVTEIPEMGKAEFFVNIKMLKGQHTEVGVVVKLNSVRPVALMAKLISKVSKKDLGSVPIINNITVDAVLEYANADMGVPADEDLRKILEEVSATASIEEGTKIKFTVPLDNLVAENGLTVAEGTDLNPYLTIKILKSVVSFEFPENVLMDMGNFLVAFVPSFASYGLKKVFKKATIKIPTFNVNIKTKEVDIKLETTDLFTLGKGFLTLEKATFELQRDKEGTWDFGLSSQTKIGDGTLKVKVKKTGDEYCFTGTLDMISTSDLLGKFEISSGVGKLMEQVSAFNFGVRNLKLSAKFGANTKEHMKISGEAIFFVWSAKFEGFIIDKDTAGKDMAFGIVVTNVDMNDLATEMFAKNGKSVKLIDNNWMSKITVSLLAGNNGEMEFDTPELKAVTDGSKAAGQFSLALPDEGGALFEADIEIPENCQKDTICEFIKKKIGAGQHLKLKGMISKSGFTLQASFEGDIKMTEKFSLKEASLMLSIGTVTEFAIQGVCEVRFEDKNTVMLRAKLSMALTGQITLTFSMSGMWDHPFGIRFLKFGNFQMSAGINIYTTVPSFEMSGELHLGYDVETSIKARLAGGFEGAEIPNFYVYVKFSTITIQSIVDAFNVKDVKLPKALMESGFPDGLEAGVSLPNGKQIESFNIYLEPGFFFKGMINILGLKMYCELQVALPTKFYLKAEFNKISIAGGAIVLRGYDDGDEGSMGGPVLEIDLDPETRKFSIKIDATVEILKISIGARIAISDEGIQFKVVGKFWDLFQATVEVSAPFGSSLEGSEGWKFGLCVEGGALDKLKDGAISDVSKGANETDKALGEQDNVNGDTGSWYVKTKNMINSWHKTLSGDEAKFKAKIDTLHKSKKDMNKACVKKCDKSRVFVGGFGKKTCKMGPNNVECPYWIPEKRMRDSPWCLADCEVQKYWFFSWVYNKAVGGYEWLDLKVLEKKMEWGSYILDGFQDLIDNAQGLFDLAERAAAALESIVQAGADLLNAIKEFTLKHILYIKSFCIEASMASWEEGLCFTLNGELYIGGINGKKVVLDNERACLNWNWVKEIGLKIAKAAFPGLVEIFYGSDNVKEIKSEKEGAKKALEAESGNINSKGKEYNNINDKNVKRSTLHSRTDEAFRDIPDDFVIRNDLTMQAFRDIFSDDDDEDEEEIAGDESEDNSKFVLANGVKIDPASLANSSNAHVCRRTQDVMNVYAGAADTVNFLTTKTEAVKLDYENFITEQNSKVELLEAKVNNMSIVNKWDDEEQEDYMFYVNKAKTGIAKWKENYDREYTIMDKTYLQSWRNYMTDVVAEKQMDIASFLDVLSTASKESAKRMEVPTGTTFDLEKTLTNAEEVIRNLLGNDDATLSSKKSTIKKLMKEVKNMKEIAKDNRCFENGLLQ